MFRPSLEVNGKTTRFLIDQLRSIDVSYIVGDPVAYLERDELAEIEHSMARYLGSRDHDGATA